MSRHLSDGALSEARGTSGDCEHRNANTASTRRLQAGSASSPSFPKICLVWAWTVRLVTKPVGDGQVREPIRQVREDLPFSFREPER
jgi:hypothetical protein